MEQSKNIKYKDSVFRKIFKEPEYVLDVIRFIMKDQTILKEDLSVLSDDALLDNGYRNDVAVLCRNRLIIMLEHQSTVNENMPLRYLFYIAKYYRSCIKGKQLYQSTRIKLPTPEFVVFYNGKLDKRPSWTQKLSDAFEEGDKGFLEIKVQWINVCKAEQNEILKVSPSLNAYATFVQQVEKGEAAGEKLKVAIKKGIQYCIAHGLLSKFFEEHFEEVETVFAEVWDYDTALAVGKEEARVAGLAEGRAEGRAKGRAEGRAEASNSFVEVMLKAKEPVAKIIQYTQLPLEKIQELATSIGVSVVM